MAPANNWTALFLRDGFFHFRHLIDHQTASIARKRIDEDLAEKYDSARKAEYDNGSFCPGLLGTPAIIVSGGEKQHQFRR
jgi:hypothetical protein